MRKWIGSLALGLGLAVSAQKKTQQKSNHSIFLPKVLLFRVITCKWEAMSKRDVPLPTILAFIDETQKACT